MLFFSSTPSTATTMPAKASTKATASTTEATPLLAAPQPKSKYDNENIPNVIAPIDPLPTPPERAKSASIRPTTTKELEFAAALKAKRRTSVAPAPGLRPVSVGPAAAQNPPEKPQNARMHKVFVEQAKQDLLRKQAAKAAGDGTGNVGM